MSVPAWLSTNLTGWRNSWNNTHPSCHILLGGLCELAACPKKPWQANGGFHKWFCKNKSESVYDKRNWSPLGMYSWLITCENTFTFGITFANTRWCSQLQGESDSEYSEWTSRTQSMPWERSKAISWVCRKVAQYLRNKHKKVAQQGKKQKKIALLRYCVKETSSLKRVCKFTHIFVAGLFTNCDTHDRVQHTKHLSLCLFFFLSFSIFFSSVDSFPPLWVYILIM